MMVNTLLKVLEQLLHKIKANRRREILDYNFNTILEFSLAHFLLFAPTPLQMWYYTSNNTIIPYPTVRYTTYDTGTINLKNIPEHLLLFYACSSNHVGTYRTYVVSHSETTIINSKLPYNYSSWENIIYDIAAWVSVNMWECVLSTTFCGTNLKISHTYLKQACRRSIRSVAK